LTKKVVERVASPDAAEDDALDEGGTLITRARHRQHVQAAVEALERFAVLSQQGTFAVDMAAEELRLATSELGRITGAVDVEDVLDKLFSDFCIGK
jgi:tRNA modification GTPase